MTAFEGTLYVINELTVLKVIFCITEFGVLPEIAKAVDELEWT